MSLPLFIAFLALWLYSITLGVVVVILIRQVGLLNLRLGPMGARPTDDGPEIGERISGLALQDQHGKQLILGGAECPPMLLVFVSGSCTLCHELLPAIRTVARSYPEVSSILVGIGEDRAFTQLVRGLRNVPLHYSFAPVVARAMRVHSTPYAIVLDKQGFVTDKGIVNQVEHLEALIYSAKGESLRREVGTSVPSAQQAEEPLNVSALGSGSNRV